MNKVYLWQDENIKTFSDRPSITPMLLEGDEVRPAVLVIPGGGYYSVCEEIEGSPIARRFNELGYHTFVLDYRTAATSNFYPAPQQDAMRAVKTIRANADKWHVDPTRIAVCGFSAGGHLAGSLGTICNRINANDNNECDAFDHRPDVMILCYGVLAFQPWSNIPTQINLIGEENMAAAEEYDLCKYVDDSTPPAFLFHTIKDQVVHYRNSLKFADAMAQAGRPCEMILYNWGEHGMLTGNDTLDISGWPEQAHRFMEVLQQQKNDPESMDKYTHAYQANHLK